jgi:hypothetical protein
MDKSFLKKVKDFMNKNAKVIFITIAAVALAIFLGSII